MLKTDVLKTFHPNREFRRRYARLFKKNPLAANLLLLLNELADEKGQVLADDDELMALMAIRFNDPEEFAL